MTGNSHIPSVAACSYPPRAGNAVRPLVDGLPAFRRIREAIKAAQHSIWLTAAFVAPDFEMPDGGALFDELDEAVEARPRRAHHLLAAESGKHRLWPRVRRLS